MNAVVEHFVENDIILKYKGPTGPLYSSLLASLTSGFTLLVRLRGVGFFVYRSVSVRTFSVMKFSVRIFFRTDFYPYEYFLQGYFSIRIFFHTDLFPYGSFSLTESCLYGILSNIWWGRTYEPTNTLCTVHTNV